MFWRFEMKNKRFGVGLDAELRIPLMRKVALINLELREDSCTFLQKLWTKHRQTARQTRNRKLP